MSNLKPLVWFETEHSVGLIQNIGAQGAGIFYRIAGVGDKVAVTWHDQTEGSTGAKELGSICEAKQWIETDHYPSKMQPYIKPSPTWINASKQLPQVDVDTQFICAYDSAIEPYVRVTTFSVEMGDFGLDHADVLAWMPIPEFSTMQNLHKGE